MFTRCKIQSDVFFPEYFPRKPNRDWPQTPAEMCKLTLDLVVVVWATGSPQWREEVKDYAMFTEEQWIYVGEFVFMLTMDEKGEKITKIVEFVDSKGTDNKITPLMMRALGNLQNLTESSGN